VRLLLLDGKPGVIALAVQGVRGDRDAGQFVGRQQGVEAGDFVRVVRHTQLGDGEAGAGDRGQQTGGRCLTVARAAGALAVHRQGLGPSRTGSGQVDQPAGTGGVQHPADGRRTRHDPHIEDRRVAAPSRASASCGTLRAHWPMAAKEHAPVSTAEQAISSTLTNE
jgi:hypothetical protein